MIISFSPLRERIRIPFIFILTFVFIAKYKFDLRTSNLYTYNLGNYARYSNKAYVLWCYVRWTNTNRISEFSTINRTFATALRTLLKKLLFDLRQRTENVPRSPSNHYTTRLWHYPWQELVPCPFRFVPTTTSVRDLQLKLAVTPSWLALFAFL